MSFEIVDLGGEQVDGVDDAADDGVQREESFLGCDLGDVGRLAADHGAVQPGVRLRRLGDALLYIGSQGRFRGFGHSEGA